MHSTEFENTQRWLIERNRAKLEKLEQEWSVLGRLRPITYEVFFDNEDDAEAFVPRVREQGFEASLLYEASNHLSVRSTRRMEPTAENVTQWENWFEEQAALLRGREQYPYFLDWSYPPKVAPTFSVEEGIWSDFSERDRANVLFGETLSFDPVSKGKYDGFGKGNSLAPPFRIVPSEFVRHARASRPSSPEPTASQFAQWLYSLYSTNYGSQLDQERGEAAEEHILSARRKAYTSIGDRWTKGKFSDWKLMHNGMHNAREGSTKFFTVKDLLVSGEPLRVLPDLIYVNRSTGEMLIVEIKHSYMAIPSNLWPNIWGQLWCYAQLEQARRATKVTVVGEVWGDAWTSGRDQMRLICLRASVRRDPKSPPYDSFFRTLFDIYRGVA